MPSSSGPRPNGKSLRTVRRHRRHSVNPGYALCMPSEEGPDSSKWLYISERRKKDCPQRSKRTVLKDGRNREQGSLFEGQQNDPVAIYEARIRRLQA